MKIGILAAKESAIDLINLLSTNKIKFNYIITLKHQKINKKNIAGFGDLRKYAKEKAINILSINHYSFDNMDVRKLKKLKLDLCVVFGWQRIIPKNALNSVKFGFFGFHGSFLKLPNGRGRSPFNWTIRKNKKKIYYNLFKYSEKFDLGDIYKTSKININTNEDILIIQKKSIILASEMIENLIMDFKKGNLKLTKQNINKKIIKFNKIIPSDCKINFDKDCSYNLNLIRASSKPFEGAYAITKKNKKIHLYEAYKVDIALKRKYESGLIILVMQDDSFFLSLKDGILFIKKHSYKNIITLNQTFLK